MSRVTNIILRTPLLNDRERSRYQEEINLFFEGENGLVNCSDDNLPRSWYGGTKVLEAELWIGAFNHFDLDKFVSHLKEISWNTGYQDWVQVIYKGQDDDRFSIIEWKINPSPHRGGMRRRND